MPIDSAQEAVSGESVVVGESGLGGLQVVVRTGDGAFVADEPASVGGLGSGPSPFDILSAALGACMTMTVRLYARRKAWPLTRVRVRVRHERPSLDARDRFEAAVSLEGGLDDDQTARLMAVAARCPVHNTLVRGSDVSVVRLATETIAAATPCEGADHMRAMDEACRDVG